MGTVGQIRKRNKEELSEDYLQYHVLQRSQGDCRLEKPQDLMKNWSPVIASSVATVDWWGQELRSS